MRSAAVMVGEVRLGLAWDEVLPCGRIIQGTPGELEARPDGGIDWVVAYRCGCGDVHDPLVAWSGIAPCDDVESMLMVLETVVAYLVRCRGVKRGS